MGLSDHKEIVRSDQGFITSPSCRSAGRAPLRAPRLVVPQACGNKPGIPQSAGWRSGTDVSINAGAKLLRSFTLVELLIVIAILAVLAAAAVLVLNPVELLAQARDGSRISDIKSLNDALNIFTTDKPGASQGSVNIVYTSLPDSDPGCASHSLPALPGGWQYRCSTAADYRKVDGAGWVPVGLTSMNGGSPIASLPIDPQNDAASGKYYTYITGGSAGGSFLLSAPMESTKQLQGASVKDGGTDASRFEVGTTMSLGASASQLIGYWRLDESSGSAAEDSSGSGNNGVWYGAGSHTTVGKVDAAGNFDGDDYVAFPSGMINGRANVSVSLWVKTNVIDQLNGIVCFETSGTSWRLCVFNDYVRLRDNDGLTHDIDLFPSATVEIGEWYHLTFVHNGVTQKFTPYVNGVSLGDTNCGTAMYSDIGSFHIGMPLESMYNFNGAIDEVRVYTRSLSASEVDSIYRSGN